MENTDFVIEHIDEEVQVIADQPSVVTNYPANTDFFIENIDSNVISIAHSLNIEASEVDFRPANTDFFIENIDKNVIAIAESMNLSPSEVDFRPANTDFFVENIDKNLIKIAESLSLTPYEVTIRPANTDMFIENIDKNVTLIKGSTNVVTVSGEYININIPDGGKVQSAQIDGNATQTGTPTPDSPQPILVVTGENVVKVMGKNLLPILDGSVTLNGITATVTDGILTLNGTSTASGYIKLTNGLVGRSGASIDSAWLNENVTNDINGKVISFDCLSGTPPTNSWAFRRFSTSTSHDQQWLAVISDTSTAFSTDDSISCLAVFINANMTFDNYKVAIQLELGSTATTYEPYQGQEFEINLGKNLFDKDNAEIVNLYNGGSGSLSNTNAWAIIMPVKPNTTYSYSNANPTAMKNDASIGFYETKPDTAGVAKTGNLITIGQNGTYTFTTPSSTEWILIYYHWAAADDATAYAGLQLELGSQPTSYSEYFTPLELAKIGTYQDRIYKEGEKWYVEKQVGKVVLDGTESWQLDGATNTYYSTSITDYAGSGNIPISDYFTGNINVSGVAAMPDNRIGFNNDPGVPRFYVRFTSIFPAQLLTSWLSTHPTTVYYALATPTTTEITNQTLIDQLEALASASLNQGVNNIFIEIETGNAMPTLKLVIEKY